MFRKWWSSACLASPEGALRLCRLAFILATCRSYSKLLLPKGFFPCRLNRMCSVVGWAARRSWKYCQSSPCTPILCIRSLDLAPCTARPFLFPDSAAGFSSCVLPLRRMTVVVEKEAVAGARRSRRVGAVVLHRDNGDCGNGSRLPRSINAMSCYIRLIRVVGSEAADI